jgi:predicted ATPase
MYDVGVRRGRVKYVAAMEFVHVRLDKWRNFYSVDVNLRSRVFIVGPNASGKSNLLDAFRFLRDIASVGGGFEDAVQRRGGVSKIRSLSARRYPEVSVSVAIAERDEHETHWTYTLGFEQDNQGRPFITNEEVFRGSKQLLGRPDPADVADRERLRQTHLEQISANKDFREVAEFLASVRYQHIVPQLVREPDRSVGKLGDPYGGDFLEQLARTNKRIRDSRFRRIREALTVAVPQLRELELERDDISGAPHLRAKYDHWRPNAGWQGEDQLSDGTIRLFGLLWAFLDGQGPLLLEEPELSLHPEVIRYIPSIMARVQRSRERQILVSTHSPDLLHDTGIGLDEVLLLRPGREGTSVIPVSSLEQVARLLEQGEVLSDALLPLAKPAQAEQLALFGE